MAEDWLSLLAGSTNPSACACKAPSRFGLGCDVTRDGQYQCNMMADARSRLPALRAKSEDGMVEKQNNARSNRLL